MWHFVLGRPLHVLSGHITISLRREKTTVALEELASKDINVCVLAHDLGDGVAAHKVEHVLPIRREERFCCLFQVRIGVDQTCDGRCCIPRGRRGVGMVHERRHVGDEPTKRPASDMDLGSIRLLKSSGPADGLRTTRVTETSHRRILVERKLVKAKRRAHRVERDVTARAPSSKGVHRALTVRHSDNVAGLQVREEQCLVHDKVGAPLRARSQAVARSSPGRVRVLSLAGDNELVLRHVVRDKHRRHRVLGLIGVVLVGAVQNLVGFLQALAKVGRLDVDGTPGQNVTSMGSLPIALGLIKAILVGRSNSRHRSERCAPNGTKASETHSDHRWGRFETFVPLILSPRKI